MHLKYLASADFIKNFNLKGPVTECQCVFFLQFINTMENIIVYLQFYISYSILNIHNYKNIQYYKKKISSDIPFNAFIVK
jgi:hypothetical protein